MCDDLTGWSKV